MDVQPCVLADYCDTFLTHDSPSVRRQHNEGYKHKANVRNYYLMFEEQLSGKPAVVAASSAPGLGGGPMPGSGPMGGPMGGLPGGFPPGMMRPGMMNPMMMGPRP